MNDSLTEGRAWTYMTFQSSKHMSDPSMHINVGRFYLVFHIYTTHSSPKVEDSSDSFYLNLHWHLGRIFFF